MSVTTPAKERVLTPPKKQRKIVSNNLSSPIAVPVKVDKVNRTENENLLENLVANTSATNSPNHKGTLKRKWDANKAPLGISASSSSATSTKLNRMAKHFSKRGTTSKTIPADLFVPRYFGRPLAELVEIELIQELEQEAEQGMEIEQYQHVPRLVLSCIDYLLPEYVMEEGIFRKSGSSADIQKLTESIDASSGLSIVESLATISDCHTVTGLLKAFIRQLPDSPVPESLHPLFLEAKQAPEIHGKIETLQKCINMLSDHDFYLLKALCGMLYKIASENETNKMTASNLSVCWSPNIFKSTAPLAGLSGLTNFVEILELIVLQTPTLFEKAEQQRIDAKQHELEERIARAEAESSNVRNFDSDNFNIAGSEDKDNENSRMRLDYTEEDMTISDSSITPRGSQQKTSLLSPPTKKDRKKSSDHSISPRKSSKSRESKTPTNIMSGTLGRSTPTKVPSSTGTTPSKPYDSQTYNAASPSFKNIGDSLKARFSSWNRAVQGNQTHNRASVFGLFSEGEGSEGGEGEGRIRRRGKSMRNFGSDSTSECEDTSCTESTQNGSFSISVSSCQSSAGSASSSPRFLSGNDESESSNSILDDCRSEINNSFRRSFLFKSPPLSSPSKSRVSSNADSLSTSESLSKKTSSPKKRRFSTSSRESPRHRASTSSEAEKGEELEMFGVSLAVQTASPRRGKTTLRTRKLSTRSKRPTEYMEISEQLQASKKARICSPDGSEKVVSIYHSNGEHKAAEQLLHKVGLKAPMAIELDYPNARKELEAVKFLVSVSNDKIIYEGLVSDLAEQDIAKVLTTPDDNSSVRSPSLVVKNVQERESIMFVGFSEELWMHYLENTN